MYVITIIPIKKGGSKETLSYLSTQSFELGSIVNVPIRSKHEKGLVLLVEKAELQKAEIKDLSFELKRIEPQEAKQLLRKSYIRALREIAQNYALPLGAFLAQNLKEETLEEEHFLQAQTELKGEIFESYAIQNRDKDRFDIYKSIIRESFAKKQSVFVVSPTEEKTRTTFEILKRGIEDYTILEVFKSKKSLKENLHKISSTTHPLLMVGTSEALAQIPNNTGVIIVDNEHSRYWRKRKRPFLDARDLLLTFAKEAKIKVFFGDLFLRTETQYQISCGKINEYGYMMNKIHHAINTLVIDMRPKEILNPQIETKKSFEVFSKELKEMIMYADKKNKKMFIFGARRGIASQTLCLDCGNVVLCHNCKAPVVLHKKIQEEKIIYSFICHHCGTKRDAFETCLTCGSWRLESFGIGTQKIAQEAEKLTGKEPFILDGDSATSPAQAKKIIDSFLKKGGILVGTEMVFDYLDEESVDYSAIASFDSLFSLPDFRANEHIMRILLRSKLLATDNILVQGRNTEDPIIETGLLGDITKFIKEELQTRKVFAYPPYKRFIKISIKNNKELVKKDIDILSKILSKWNPKLFPAFVKGEKDKTIANMLISLSLSSWPDEELRNILLSLPPYIEVKVDPESLL